MVVVGCADVGMMAALVRANGEEMMVVASDNRVPSISVFLRMWWRPLICVSEVNSRTTI